MINMTNIAIHETDRIAPAKVALANSRKNKDKVRPVRLESVPSALQTKDIEENLSRLKIMEEAVKLNRSDFVTGRAYREELKKRYRDYKHDLKY
jgi:hypothetical protein